MSLLADADDDHVTSQVAANLLGPMWCSRAAIPLLDAAGGGDIVNISSRAVELARPYLSVSPATKGGLETFTRTLAAELQPHAIRVSSIPASGPPRPNPPPASDTDVTSVLLAGVGSDAVGPTRIGADPDALGSQLGGERAGERLEAALGGGVHGEVGPRQLDRARGDVDDVAAARRVEQRDRGPAAPHRPEQVRGDDRLHVRVVGVRRAATCRWRRRCSPGHRPDRTARRRRRTQSAPNRDRRRRTAPGGPGRRAHLRARRACPRDRASSATAIPASCSTRAIDAPMPCEAPVTTATFPVRSIAGPYRRPVGARVDADRNI